MYFWNPGFHAIDGSEPKVGDLVNVKIHDCTSATLIGNAIGYSGTN